MPIFDAAPELTSGPRALNLFTDRVPYLRAFCERIHATPQPETILFFHGVGGAGKSLLLRYLRQNACKLLTAEEWERASRFGEDDVFREQILQARGVKSVASTWLDFSAMPTGEDRPREPFSALLMLRRQLGKQGIQTPLFDYAALWYLYRTQGKVPTERLRQLFPSEALDIATGIFYLFDTQVPGIGLARSVIDIFAKNVEERFTLFWQRRGLDEDVVVRIQSMEPQPDLVDYLPILFAQDLNGAMATSRAPARLVLFFDTHEALFTNSESQYSTREDLGDAAYFGRDEWLRALFGHLELGQGIVPVLASRDAPRWAEAARWRIPATHVDPHLVGNLSASDAALYLTRAGIGDVALQQAVVEYSNGHPFYLGLCAETVLAAQAQGQPLAAADFVTELDRRGRNRLVVERFLRYVGEDVQYAVQALSAARDFDWPLYRHLGQELGFHPTRAAYEALLAFSFVEATAPRTSADGERPDGEQRYRMHSILRKQLAEHARARSADPVLEAWYRQQTNDETALAEAIYHATRQDVARGVAEWIAVFDPSYWRGRLGLCAALAEVARDMDWVEPAQRGAMNVRVAKCALQLGRYADAEAGVLLAFEEFDSALRNDPNDAYALAERGLGALTLIYVFSKLQKWDEAESAFGIAQEACEAAIRIAPHAPDAYATLIRACGETIGVRTGAGQHDRASEAFAQAQTVFEAAQQAACITADIYCERATALVFLGHLYVKMGDSAQAQTAYGQALEILDAALQIDPLHYKAFHNHGFTLLYLGDLETSVGRYEAAVSTFRRAIAGYDAQLRAGPGDFGAMWNIGYAALGVGKAEVELARYEEAAASLAESLSFYDRAMPYAPTEVEMLSERGETLRVIGDLHAIAGEFELAVDCYKQAIQTQEATLQIAPNVAYAQTRLATAREKLDAVQGVARPGDFDT